MQRRRAVLWDFDGVIFDSDKAVLQARNAILRHHGLAEQPFEEYRHRPHNHFRYYRERGIELSDGEIRNFFYAAYDPSDCGLVAGVRTVLSHLHISGVTCGIVSGHTQKDIHEKLVQFGIGRYFSFVRGGVFHKKESIEEACVLLAVPVAETWYVGDMFADVEDGKAAGVTTVLYAPHDYPYRAHAHHHITDLVQLQTLFTV